MTIVECLILFAAMTPINTVCVLFVYPWLIKRRGPRGETRSTLPTGQDPAGWSK